MTNCIVSATFAGTIGIHTAWQTRRPAAAEDTDEGPPGRARAPCRPARPTPPSKRDQRSDAGRPVTGGLSFPRDVPREAAYTLGV